MSAPEETTVHSGGCFCGAVRYRLSHPLGDTAHCHCRMCQQAVGAPVVTWTSVPIGAFAWTAGHPGEHRSSERGLRSFCRECGTSLTFRLDGDTVIDVTVASLDDPEAAVPDRNIWTGSRLAWMHGFDRDLPDEMEENVKPT
ncbi:GFA family protein [Amorphus orientalis]|uniref:CENP-V/GFA domain-containing protein n=1 Tax=Amorphus orientalis TaxID=649198 RepID=A0AAE3VPD1_9HYPH|nr:GFA family protein [Amorphus orientalis]MDQ0315573.1 hypothetical protein [Amorphus orientalis]